MAMIKKASAEDQHQENNNESWIQPTSTFDVLFGATKSKDHGYLEEATKNLYFGKYRDLHSSLYTRKDLMDMEGDNKRPWPNQEGTKCRTPGCSKKQRWNTNEYRNYCCKAFPMHAWRYITNWHAGDDPATSKRWIAMQHGPKCDDGPKSEGDKEDEYSPRWDRRGM